MIELVFDNLISSDTYVVGYSFGHKIYVHKHRYSSMLNQVSEILYYSDVECS